MTEAKTPGKFEGWLKLPEEVRGLTPGQVEKLNSLERIQVKGQHASMLVGTEQTSLNRQDVSVKEDFAIAPLFRFIKETAIENNTNPLEVVKNLRLLGIEGDEKRREIEKRYVEKIGYVSDIHGGDEQIINKLWEMVKEKPDYVFFEGDLIGTKAFEDLQKLFYNSVKNHYKELTSTNSNPTDKEILNYVGKNAQKNLREGYLDIFRYELKLQGMDEEEAKKAIEMLSDQDIAERIKKTSSYVHYGHYASNLPEKAKEALASGLEESAKKILAPIKKLQEQNCQVYMMEGNWDARIPIDFVPGTSEVIPLPENKRLFRAKKFFEANGVPFYNKISVVETKTMLHILAPFDGLSAYSEMEEKEINDLLKKVQEARDKDLSIVVVAHASPSWLMHNLFAKGVFEGKISGENKLTTENLLKLIGKVKPDEIVYGHSHDPIIDEEKAKIDPNQKYVIQVVKDGSTMVVEAPSDLGQAENQVVATYVPFRETGWVEVPKKEKFKKITGMGGKRQPVRVGAKK